MKQLILIISILIASQTFAGKKLPDWAKADGRTQAGGFIWFPGKFIHKSRVIANSMATGRAIEYLVMECKVPHIETRFIEKFERIENGVWEVYLRASIKDDQCRQGRYGNKKTRKRITDASLLTKYWTYKLYDENLRVDSTVCYKGTKFGCFDVVEDEWKLKNNFKAIAYGAKGCSFKDYFLCGFTGFMLSELGQDHRAVVFMGKACRNGYKAYCFHMKALKKKIAKR